MLELQAIVADIGGTNARFSCVDLATMTIHKLDIYPCANYSSLQEAFHFYQQKHRLNHIKQAALAIACPVTEDRVQMTNFHWQFSVKSLKAELGLEHLQVMNDFTAAAMAVPHLSDSQKMKVGDGQVQSGKPMIILGAGTGLGVATLIPLKDGFIPLPGEGGHVDWAPQTEQEWFIQRHLTAEYGHVSVERLLCGEGLVNIYKALSAYKGRGPDALTADQITERAMKGSCSMAGATVAQFFAALGSVAGDLALTVGAFGGVYIAGGIVPRLLPLLKTSEFRSRFEAKGRFSAYNRSIASFIITAEQPGISGAAFYLKQIIGTANGI